jgi:hypothetical protein
MSSIESEAPATVAAQARMLRRLTTTLVAGTGVLLFWPIVYAFACGRPITDWAVWAHFAAPVIYLWGLVQLRGAFAQIAAGDLFGPVTQRALSRLGVAMILGSALQAVVVPNLLFWLSSRKAGGALLNFDVAAFTVGAIGAGLLLIARLFGEAGNMANELEEIL